jgi:hypothetical protein
MASKPGTRIPVDLPNAAAFLWSMADAAAPNRSVLAARTHAGAPAAVDAAYI